MVLFSGPDVSVVVTRTEPASVQRPSVHPDELHAKNLKTRCFLCRWSIQNIPQSFLPDDPDFNSKDLLVQFANYPQKAFQYNVIYQLYFS